MSGRTADNAQTEQDNPLSKSQNAQKSEDSKPKIKRNPRLRQTKNQLSNEGGTSKQAGRRANNLRRANKGHFSGSHEQHFRNNGEIVDSPPGGGVTVGSSRSDILNPRTDTMGTLENQMNDLDLRENLIEQLRSGSYTCVICLSTVKPRDHIWSCNGCYHMYHLNCITGWALSGTHKSEKMAQETQDVRSSWRCPACQQSHTYKTNPLIYRCFCGKTTRPAYHPGSSTVPHGCDEVCGKPKASSLHKQTNTRAASCPHFCTELCHPGPCPPCVAVVELHCPCGRVVRTSRCGEEPPKPCGALCERLLSDGNCAFGIHHCPLPCHDGDCPPCMKLIKSICYCGRVDEITYCGSGKAKSYDLSEARSQALVGELDLCDLTFFDGSEEEKESLLSSKGPLEALFVGTVFSCKQICNRPLACGYHTCAALCHPGECPPCLLLPSQCLTCPCGRVPLSKLVTNGDVQGNRKRCTDPIPVCPNVCGRPNPICGHPCPEKCHLGPSCPPCKLTTQITCRCGKSSKEVPCLEYAQAMKNDPSSVEFLCGRTCRKRKSCGRHKCNRKCCDMVIHACQEVCGRTLACGKHTCEDLCHCGPCGACWRGVINEEVYCHCGATFLPPPQPCGTAPPECAQPCSRPHACDHPVQHTCHSEPECPKCTVLMTKRCPGDHTWMFNVPCFQTVATCGRTCNKPLPGCSHLCRRQCHPGECLSSGEGGDKACKQACAKPRAGCGHPCGQPCHEVAGISCAKALGSLKCDVPISLVCRCGHRREEQPCYRVKTLIAGLEKKDPNFVLRHSSSTGLPFGLSCDNILPCDSSCLLAEQEAKTKAEAEDDASARNAPKMWVRGGANVVDESLPPAFPPPEYSDWLKQFASNNLSFAAEVEKVLFDLVDEALKLMKLSESKPKSNKCVSHRFNPMNHTKRRFIIELAEFYGIECVELDPPPHRYVEALATGGRVHFPGGGSRQHYTSLTSQIQASFVGSVKIDLANAPAPVHVAARPAPLRCITDVAAVPSTTSLLSFSSVVGGAADRNGNQSSQPN